MPRSSQGRTPQDIGAPMTPEEHARAAELHGRLAANPDLELSATDKALLAKMKKCNFTFKGYTYYFDWLKAGLNPEAGAWCAFTATFVATLFLALATGWYQAAATHDLSLSGPMVMGSIVAMICVIGTFCLCTPELNLATHLAKFALDEERFGKNLFVHLAHIAGGFAGYFIGYFIVHLVFSDFPGAYEQATAYLVAPYSVGRGIVTEIIFGSILVLGTLALLIVVPKALIGKGISDKTGSLIICLAEGVLVFLTSAATWNVTGGFLNPIRWLAAATMNGSYSFAVADSWWIFPVGSLAFTVIGYLLFVIFNKLLGRG